MVYVTARRKMIAMKPPPRHHGALMSDSWGRPSRGSRKVCGIRDLIASHALARRVTETRAA
jgi:hypothetical protein